MDIFSSSSAPYLAKVLDVVAQRHGVIANNIANANTPQFQAKDINFKEVLARITQLKQEAATPDEFLQIADEIDIEKVPVNPDYDSSMGNDVNVETEMVKLAKNGLLYKMYASLLRARLQAIKSAINEKG